MSICSGLRLSSGNQDTLPVVRRFSLAISQQEQQNYANQSGDQGKVTQPGPNVTGHIIQED